MHPTLSTTQRGHLQRLCLTNGITLLVGQNAAVEILAAHCFFRGGSRVEQPQQAGLSQLLAAVLTKGTRQRDSQAIAAWVESLGASLSVDSAADHFEVALRCVAEDFPELLQLLAEILRDPSFPEAEVARERDLMLQAIRARQERPFSLAFDQVRRALYGDHPYALPELGGVETVGSLTREDLLAYHATYCRPEGMVMAVIGPEPPETVAAQVEAALGDWVSAGPPAPDPALPLSPLERPQLLKLPQPTQQTTILMGFRGSPAASADYPALKLLATYLGSGLSSRLFVELRERSGLAYEVSAFFCHPPGSRPFWGLPGHGTGEHFGGPGAPASGDPSPPRHPPERRGSGDGPAQALGPICPQQTNQRPSGPTGRLVRDFGPGPGVRPAVFAASKAAHPCPSPSGRNNLPGQPGHCPGGAGRSFGKS